MKLVEVRIRNFRCYKNEFSVKIDDLTCLIAKNDVGKSTVLEALEAFFNLEKLEGDDRSAGVRSTEPIEITCTFTDLPTTLVVDTDALISPHNEYLLNRAGSLEIRRRFTGSSPKCEEIYVKALHPTAPGYADLFNLNITALRQRATGLGVDLANVNQTVKSAIRHSIWLNVSREELLLQEIEIEVKSTIWKGLQNALPMFQLFRADRPSSDQDAEAQDPIKFAVKEALATKVHELEAIGTFVRQQVEEVTRGTIEKLREMDPALANELNPIFSPCNWAKVFSVSLTGEDQIPLNKRGSGVRRMFLINFFRAKAEQLAAGRPSSKVILAIEEPETSQHPNNQLMILDALYELSQDPSNRVLLTTHNPLLARKIDLASLRFIEKDATGTRYIATNDDACAGRIKQTLGILPNNDVRVFVGVEGPNDIEFLNRISSMLATIEPDIPNLATEELAGRLVYVPMGGSTLELWTNRLQGLDLPEIHIMDRDEVPPARARYQDAADRLTARGGRCHPFTTTCREMENLIHFEAVNEEFGTALTAIDLFDDVPAIVAEHLHAVSGSPTAWANLDGEKRSKKISSAKKRLNRGCVARMTPARLDQSDQAQQVRSWLRTIGQYVLV
jgi:putative ATP-dependent endonuclease of OLD family